MGFVKDAIGGIGDAIGGAIGEVPILGDALGEVGGAVGPLAGLIPGIGPIASTVLGAIGGGAQGGGQGLLQGAGAGFGSQQIMETLRNARADQERARELVGQGMDRANQASDIALGQFRADQPLRQAFRSGALGFHDPTNPFSTNPLEGAGGGGIPGATPPIIPNPPQPTDMGGNIPQPGTIRSRVEGLLDRRFGGGGFQPVRSPTPSDEPSAVRGGNARGTGGFDRGSISRSVQEALDRARQSGFGIPTDIGANF